MLFSHAPKKWSNQSCMVIYIIIGYLLALYLRSMYETCHIFSIFVRDVRFQFTPSYLQGGIFDENSGDAAHVNNAS